MTDTVSSLAQKLRPYWLGDITAGVNVAGGGGGGGALSAHALSGVYHTGQLAESQATWAGTKAELVAHALLADVHHAAATAGNTAISVAGQAVSLALATNSGLSVSSGLTLGTPTALTVATTNSITTSTHAHAITSSSNPGAAASLLASASSGLLTLSQFKTNDASSAATFASGFAGSGWRADYAVTTAARASIETDDLTVRGRMRVYELLIQQIRATNGSVFVSSASKVVTVTVANNPLWTVNGSQLTFNGANATLTTNICAIATATADDIDGGNDKQLYHGFLVGDVTRAQQVRWDGAAFAGIIQSDLEVTSVTGLYTYGAALVASDLPDVGYDYVRLGSTSDTSRQGTVYLTSDDSAAPFIDIVDGVSSHAQWNTPGKIKARLGKLSGITDDVFGALSGYGLWSENVYLTGAIYATSGTFSGTVYASAGTFTGAITSTSGTIGGWTLGATSLIAGSGANTVGLDSGGTNPALYAGSATPASAPFRVTKAGALTATNATITGTITASSGSITGNFYAGSSSVRLSTDGQRLLLPNTTGIDVPASSSALRWFSDIDGTHNTSKNYAGVVAYRHTSYNVMDTMITNFVGSTDYATYEPRIFLQAGHHDGATYTDSIFAVAMTTANVSYAQYTGNFFNISAALRFVEISTPTNPASSKANIYINAAANKLVIQYNDGGTIRYKYLPLNGTSVTWVHDTAAP
jgi:hypothetical protein